MRVYKISKHYFCSLLGALLPALPVYTVYFSIYDHWKFRQFYGYSNLALLL